MEAPGFLTLLYIINTLPAEQGIASLPWENKVMGALFVRFLGHRYVAVLMKSAGNPLHLPRYHDTLPQPLDVPYPPSRLALRPHVPTLKWHLHRLLARRLRPHNPRRVAERSKLQSWRAHGIRYNDLGSRTPH